MAFKPGDSAAQKTLEKQKQIDQIDLQVKFIATKVGQFDKTHVVDLFQVLKNEITSVADILDHFDISDLDEEYRAKIPEMMRQLRLVEMNLTDECNRLQGITPFRTPPI